MSTICWAWVYQHCTWAEKAHYTLPQHTTTLHKATSMSNLSNSRKNLYTLVTDTLRIQSGWISRVVYNHNLVACISSVVVIMVRHIFHHFPSLTTYTQTFVAYKTIHQMLLHDTTFQLFIWSKIVPCILLENSRKLLNSYTFCYIKTFNLTRQNWRDCLRG